MEATRQNAARQNPQASAALCDIFIKNITFPPNSVIASYYARGTEMDPSSLTNILRTQGHIIALPVMNGKKAPLLFRCYESSSQLALGHFGVHEPLPHAPLAEPDILIVPLLAFDKMMGRLGYGGGYYDRTLFHLRQSKKILAIGIGYSCQEIPEIPMTSFDARLDKVATELQIF